MEQIEVASCNICFDDFHKYRKPLTCPGCSKDAGQCCKECAKDYILSSPINAHCSICKLEWGPIFLSDCFSKDFLTKDYRKNRQEKALEREKGLLPQTMPLVEIEKRKIQQKETIREIMERKEILKKKYHADMFELDREIIMIKQNEDFGDVKAAKYTFPCAEEDCKGFIESKSWKCGVCEVKICRKCHVKREKKHKCDENDKETAKMVMKDTKPCPKCKARIFKISGCDQMFCTECHTPWSWNTGEIVSGTIHNPHYYEMQRKMGGGIAPPRNPGDVVCGGMPDWYVVMRNKEHIFVETEDTKEKTFIPEYQRKLNPDQIEINLNEETLRNYHRRTTEIQNYIARERLKLAANGGLEKIRLRYLMGELKDEVSFKKSIFIKERNLKKKEEELQILDTFVTAISERFRELTDNLTSIEENGNRKDKKSFRKAVKMIKKLLKDVPKIRKFCNHAFATNFTALQYNRFPQIDFEMEYKCNLYSKEI